MIDWDKIQTAEQKNAKKIQDQIDRVRSERNRLLIESDWTQLSDAPVDKQSWSEYRQSLRDIPQQAGFPTDITWPEKPTQS